MNLTLLMREYLNESTQTEIQRTLFGKIDKSFPIEVEAKPKWKTLEDPQRLARKFKFESSRQVLQFVREVLQFEESISHNGLIKISGLEITIEVYTHTVEEITELDIEYAEEVSKIYKDVRDYER